MAVSVQQAAFNALARHIENNIGSDVTISRQWPNSDMQIPGKMVSCIFAGSRRDIPIDIRMLRQVDGVDPATTVTWQIRACEQSVQLDVWARNDSDRDDVVARLDSILNMEDGGLGGYGRGGVGNGTLLKLKDGWVDTYADFYFDQVEITDAPDAQLRREYRSTFSGYATFMLTVDRATVKQKLINLKLSFDEGDTYDTIEIS